MNTAIQELIHFIENDRMQSSYTKEQVIELLTFKLEKEKEQTAVEWLVEELTKQNMFMHLFAKEINQAKEIERSQKAEEYLTGFENGKKFKSE